ncbi:sulfotransferase [Nitzschia inconspicua]|uniref:Sulfotransferase n=1 Tax=Nitzschia inconspicua TaxID=303405 RepID=A0A9K3KU29_9STRA|nr:sulfotransferase [Nitzschia inconspicua]
MIFPFNTRTEVCRKSSLLVPSILLTLVILVLFIVTWVMENSPMSGLNTIDESHEGNKFEYEQHHDHNSVVDVQYIVPKALLDVGVYKEDEDFENERGIKPTYWRFNSSLSWGPCLPPLTPIKQWEDRRNYTTSVNTESTEDFDYLRPIFQQHPPTSIHSAVDQSRKDYKSRQQQLQRGGGCRPGFLIIGAGKCGTSSLYHYLVGHPRVLPAFEKQIHYFKYHLTKPLGWYFSFFPTPRSFLEHGGLMTGEASPGYLPYPQVAKDVRRIMKQQPHHDLPKIIMVGRSPLERMYSSYRYNYVYPTLEYLRKGRHHGIPKDLSDEEYEPYLFSLEDFVRSELAQLKLCLNWVDRNNEFHKGFGAQMTFDQWNNQAEFRDALMKRNQNSSDAKDGPPLIDLDGSCYGSKVSSTVLRPQWAELQTQNTEKVIVDQNLHLTQAMIGRSLYTFPLEWWYLVFDQTDIFFVCTEELSNPETMRELALNLGLPSYNFSQVVDEGAYNVGGHRGYDKATSWEELQAERGGATMDAAKNQTNGIPITPSLYEELQEFVRPYNERLFQLTGKRCQW